MLWWHSLCGLDGTGQSRTHLLSRSAEADLTFCSRLLYPPLQRQLTSHTVGKNKRLSVYSTVASVVPSAGLFSLYIVVGFTDTSGGKRVLLRTQTHQHPGVDHHLGSC